MITSTVQHLTTQGATNLLVVWEVCRTLQFDAIVTFLRIQFSELGTVDPHIKPGFTKSKSKISKYNLCHKYKLRN